MKLKAFTIYDSKIQSYSPPFFMKHVGEAERAFVDVASNGQSQIFKSPQDFSLIYIGEFDEELGVLIPGNHHSYGTADSFINKKLN